LLLRKLSNTAGQFSNLFMDCGIHKAVIG